MPVMTRSENNKALESGKCPVCGGKTEQANDGATFCGSSTFQVDLSIDPTGLAIM